MEWKIVLAILFAVSACGAEGISSDPEASVECVMCEFAMSELKGLIGKNSTEKEIEEALDKVCSLLPSTVRTECTEFVDKYGAEVLKLLSQELNPAMVCTSLGLCKQGKVNSLVTFYPKVELPNDEKCNICIKIAGMVKKLAADNVTVEQTEKLLDIACFFMGVVMSECKAFVKEYVPKIFKMVANSDPEKVCEELKLCPSDFPKKCSFGPSYWCRNHVTARQCHAIPYCKMFAWRN